MYANIAFLAVVNPVVLPLLEGVSARMFGLPKPKPLHQARRRAWITAKACKSRKSYNKTGYFQVQMNNTRWHVHLRAPDRNKKRAMSSHF